jgi:hypothetical protein
MKIKAVIDRFEEDMAVILLVDDDQKLIVPREELPSDAAEGHWLILDFEDQPGQSPLLEANIDEEETEHVRKRISDKLNRLRRGDHLEK